MVLTPEELQDMRLQDLILRRKRELRLTWDELVERSTAAGYTISVARWHHWAQTDWTSTPNPDVVRGIAAALELSTDTVYEAAGVSVQLYTRSETIDEKTRAMVVTFGEVDAADQDMVLAMIRGVTQTRRAQARGKAGETS